MLRVKKIKPLSNKILVTCEKYQVDVKEGAMVVASKGTLKEHQEVLAIGPFVRDIKVGNFVKINPSRYQVRQYDDNSIKNDLGMNKVIRYNFPMVTVDDEECMLLTDGDVDYVVEEFDEVGTFSKKPIIVTESTPKIITNNKIII